MTPGKDLSKLKKNRIQQNSIFINFGKILDIILLLFYNVYKDGREEPTLLSRIRYLEE